MNKVFFILMIAILSLAVGCNQSGNNAQQQDQFQGFGPGGGMGGGFGGGNFNPEEMAQRQVDQMKETVGLSDEQAKQIYDLTLENQQAQSKMREQMQGGGGAEGMREMMQQMRDEQDAKIKAVLSAEQWAKYEAYQEETRSRRGQGGPGGQGGPRMN